MKLSFLSLLSMASVLWGVAQGGDPLNLKPEAARLTGCVLETKYGPVNIGNSDGKDMEACWDIDLPEGGTYRVELVFSCDDRSIGGAFEFKSGNSVMVWTSAPTAGWEFFQKRYVGEMVLKKGKQTFSIKNKSGKSIAIRSLRLVPEPGVIVPLGGSEPCVLNGDTVNLGGPYQDKDGWMCGNSNGDKLEWNLSSPEEKKYALVFVYGTPGKNAEFEVRAGNGRLQVELPPAMDWRAAREHEAGMVTIPAGISKLSLIKKDGALDIKEVKLVFSEKLEAELNALKERPRLGMSLADLEKIWGGSSTGETFNLERRGGKDDVDWTAFKGLAPLVRMCFWNKSGMKITAAMLNDRCIAININMPDKSLKGAREVASILMPGVSFAQGKSETNYSGDKAYKMQYWGSSFDLKASSLVRNMRKEMKDTQAEGSSSKESSGKDYSYMGRSLEELRNKWGDGEERDGCNIEFRGDKNDIDWMLYKEIKPETISYWWRYPQQNNLNITAVFWRNRCIAFDISKIDGFSAQELMAKVNELIPGVTFSSIPQKKGEVFTVYSTSHDRGYKLQNWGGYFELKASGLIREIQEEHEKDLRSAAAKLYKRLQAIQKEKDTSLFGKTSAEMDVLLGASEQKDKLYRKKVVRVWKFPGTTLELHGVFGSLGDRDVCCHLLIVDRFKGLVAPLALPLAQQAVAPFVLKSVAKDDMKTWFSTTSRDQGARFFVEWYEDPSTKATMCITDMVALRAWEQAEKERKDKEKEKTFDKVKQSI